MGKNNKKRKRNHALFHAVKARITEDGVVAPTNAVDNSIAKIHDVLTNATTDATTTTKMTEHDVDDINNDDNEISDSALLTTIKTLETLVIHKASLFHSKRFKDLRRTLHPLVLEQLQSYDKGIDYRHKVTQSLSLEHWSDALAALQACRDFEQYPKQGTIQRWVRDASAAASAHCQLQLLQAILMVSQDARDSNNKHDPGQALAHHLATQPGIKNEITIEEGWKWWEEEQQNKNKNEKSNIENNIDDKKEKEDSEENGQESVDFKSRIVYQEAAAERTPPNHYDLILHTTEPGCSSIQWATTPPPTGCHLIPFLPTPARVLSHVLTPYECRQLISRMTTLGYRPDHPVALEAPTGIDSCEWMIDETISQAIFDRVKPHLPATLTLPHHNKVVQLHSINPRWRGFRYGQDCVYRPHLDGSWPQSYINEDGDYCCPKQSTIKSYLTCLIYLNDDFEGGETRFYLPQGIARGIVPQTGSVAVFPQGNMASLIHEGSQVTRGTKYVVRTDVLYAPFVELEEEEEEKDNKQDSREDVDGAENEGAACADNED